MMAFCGKQGEDGGEGRFLGCLFCVCIFLYNIIMLEHFCLENCKHIFNKILKNLNYGILLYCLLENFGKMSNFALQIANKCQKNESDS